MDKKNYYLTFEKYFQNEELDENWQVMDYIKNVKNNTIVVGIVPDHVNEIEQNKSDAKYVRYVKDNVSLKDGYLCLTGTKDDKGYAGAAVKFEGRKFGNGYMEIKAKFPDYMPGVWPRFTLKGKKDVVNTEIDFAQVMGVKSKNACTLIANYTDDAGYHNLNYLYSRDNAWPRFYPDAQNDEILPKGWHVYGYEQTDTDAIFYVDSVEFCRVDIDNPVFDAFGSEGQLWLSLGLGLPKIEAPDENTILPCNLLIEYIKFYEEEK